MEEKGGGKGGWGSKVLMIIKTINEAHGGAIGCGKPEGSGFFH